MLRALITASLGLAVLTACGETREQRTLTGAAGGGVAGAVVGGPVGALAGAGIGAATGAYREEVEDAADEAVGRGAEEATQAAASAGEPRRRAVADDLTNREVRDAQEALREIGLYEGEVDGMYGPRTINAVGEFQERENLPRTRALDDRTMERLMAAADPQSGATQPGQQQGGQPSGALREQGSTAGQPTGGQAAGQPGTGATSGSEPAARQPAGEPATGTTGTQPSGQPATGAGQGG